jgi:hypothetical protein
MKAPYLKENRLLNIVSEEMITLPLEDPKDKSLVKRANGKIYILLKNNVKLTKHCCHPKEFIHFNKLLQVHKDHNPNYCLRISFNNSNLCTILGWRLCVCN